MRQFFLLRLSTNEKEIMGILWEAGKSLSTNEVLDKWNTSPKPSYNAIATHLTRLSHKNFVEYKKRDGEKTFYYSPVISSAKYKQRIVVSICMFISVSLTAVAAIVVSMSMVFTSRHTQPNPKPEVPVVQPKDTGVVQEQLDSVVPIPSLSAEFGAEFGGGSEAIQAFFEEHWNRENEGRVYLQLIIDRTGKVKEAKAIIDPSTNPELARELEKTALRMPKWKPAMKNGSSVASKTTITVVLLNE